MAKLFTRPDGSKIEFYIDKELSKKERKEYVQLIESNGGIIVSKPDDLILTFSTPELCLKFPFVFDLQFIKDCVEQRKILNVNNYFIGDRRCVDPCKMGKFARNSNECYGEIRKAERLKEEKEAEAKEKILNDTEIVPDSDEEESLLDSEEEIHSIDSEKETDQSIDNLSDSDESVTIENGSDTDFNESISSGSEYEESSSGSEYKPHIKVQKSIKEEKNSRLKLQRNSRYNKLPITTVVDLSDHSEVELEEEGELSESEAENQTQDLTEWRNVILENRKKDKEGYPIRRGPEVEKWELEVMIQFIIKLRRFYGCQTDSIWILARNLKLLPVQNTVCNMRTLVAHHILPSIEDFNLPPNIEEKFVNYRTFGRVAGKYPVSELTKWANNLTKNIKKDNSGYPESDAVEFQSWEKKFLIKYLHKIGLSHISEEFVWLIASKLKLFPAHRLKADLQYEFRFNILPNIRNFDLDPQMKNQFIRLSKHSSRYKQPSKDLVDWAKNVTKDLEKDDLGYPCSTKRSFPDWEVDLMLKYLEKTNLWKEALSRKTWNPTLILQLFPKCRNPGTIITYIKHELLPKIESYHLDKEFEDILVTMRDNSGDSTRPSNEMKEWAQEALKERAKDEEGFPISDKATCEPWERKLMIEFLIHFDKVEHGIHRTIWKLAYNSKIFPKRRKYQALYNDFTLNVLANIELYEMDEEILNKFLKLRTSQIAPPKDCNDPPKYLKKWAKKMCNFKKKDKQGYPLGNEKFATWEKKLMIDFLIKAKKIKEATFESTWRLCCALKIFPQHRTPLILATKFRKQILQEVHTYSLPKDIEAEFLELKSRYLHLKKTD